jgi:integrase
MSTTVNKDRHLYQNPQSGIWYVRAFISGKRVSESTHVTDVEHARKIRDSLLAAAVISRATGTAPKRTGPFASIPEILAAYEQAARLCVGDRARAGYHSAIRQVLLHAGIDPETATADCLTRATVRAYRAAVIRDPTNKRQRTTARSTLRQAKALFARWTEEEDVYAGMHLPDLTGFMRAGGFRHGNGITHYSPRPPALVEATRAAAETLPADLKVAWILCYHCAMRKSEVIAAKWDWLGKDGDNRDVIHLINRPDFTLKGVLPRSVPIHPDAYAHLVSGCGESPYILPGATRNQRAALIARMNQWLRTLGWDRDTYDKGVHELRKLRGAQWFTQIGPAYAQQMLGHVSLRTTESFYACYLKGHDALPD